MLKCWALGLFTLTFKRNLLQTQKQPEYNTESKTKSLQETLDGI